MNEKPTLKNSELICENIIGAYARIAHQLANEKQNDGRSVSRSHFFLLHLM